MLRRRSAGRRGVVATDDQRRRLDSLRASGWVLPFALGGDRPPEWTLVGTVDSAWATAVDPCGLITPFGPASGWSLDWWVGADDRWHLPSTDAGVRQHLIGSAPMVETLVRIPGGDAVQRVYAIRGETFAGGDEWVVVEVENRSSVPFAIAFAIRPATPEGLGSVSSIEMAPVGGGRGRGRDAAHAVSVDGSPALLFERRPARIAASTAADGDVAGVVLRGDAAVAGDDGWTGPRCPDGLAQTAFVFPVAHTTTIRVALPIGAEPASQSGWPAVVPPVAHVVAGWDAHVGPAFRIDIPAPQLAVATDAARRSLLLAPWADGRRLAGPPRHRSGAVAYRLADTGRIVATLDRLGHHSEAARTLRRWPDLLAAAAGSSEDDIAVIEAVATHRLLAQDESLFDDLLPDVVASVARLDRRRARVDNRTAAARSLATLAQALDVSGQPDGAVDVRSVAARLGGAPDAADPVGPRPLLQGAVDAIGDGQPAGLGLLDQAMAVASDTFGFAGPGEPQDLVAAALLIDAVRALLVQDSPGRLDLLRVFPPQWYGGPVDVHDAPTAHGSLSYAVRWHGTRPALLWELDRPPGAEPVSIAVPGLDPSWSTTEIRGEALLAEVAPPAGLESIRLVAEHPGDGGTFA